MNERIRPGAVIEIERRITIEERSRLVTVRLRVLKQYRHHVLVENKYGSRCCITHAELFQNGIVTQRMTETVETP